MRANVLQVAEDDIRRAAGYGYLGVTLNIVEEFVDDVEKDLKKKGFKVSKGKPLTGYKQELYVSWREEK